MTDSSDNLLNVHQILAAAEPETPQELVTQTFRLPKQVKELTDQICQQNGKTTSEFLRACCETLVHDYMGN